MKAGWARLSERKRHFATNLVIGTAISLALLPLENSAAVLRARDALLTWQVAQFNDTDIGRDLVWIDVDQTTYLAWHSPMATPRDKLCRLVDFAVRGGARVVVVDVDFSQPATGTRTAETCNSGAPPGTVALPPERVLSDYLHAYARRCAPDPAKCAKVVLTQTLFFSYRSTYADGAPARAVRPSFLDAPFASPAVVWGTADFDLDDDAVVRRWRLWEPVCDPSATLPAVELLAVKAYGGPVAEKLPASAPAKYRASCVPLQGSSGTQPARDDPPAASVASLEGESEDDRRFFYRIGWDQARGEPRMTFIPAALIADSTTPVDAKLIAGRIVVIGGSYLDDPDFHLTPTGVIPGTLVLINAINSLIADDHVTETPVYLRFAVELVLIVLFSALFLYMAPARAMLTGCAFIIFAALTFGIAFLNRGIWIDPVLPLLGILCHEEIARIERRRERRRERRLEREEKKELLEEKREVKT